MLKHLHIVYIFILFPFFRLGSRTRDADPSRHRIDTPDPVRQWSPWQPAMTASQAHPRRHRRVPTTSTVTSHRSASVEWFPTTLTPWRHRLHPRASWIHQTIHARAAMYFQVPSYVVSTLSTNSRASQMKNSCRCWLENSIWTSTNSGTGLVVTTLQWRRLP